MEEDIKNMSKEELLEYLEDISQQLDNIALDQIQFAISELQLFKEEYKKLEEDNKELVKNNYRLTNELENKRKEYQETYKDVREELKELKNDIKLQKIFNKKLIETSIPTSVIQNKIDENNKLIEQCLEDEEHYGEIFLYKHDNEVLQEIIEEGRNNK